MSLHFTLFKNFLTAFVAYFSFKFTYWCVIFDDQPSPYEITALVWTAHWIILALVSVLLQVSNFKKKITSICVIPALYS